MSYALITSLIFAIVAIMHGWRIYNRWAVQTGAPLHFHECVVGWPCRSCAAGDLGFLADPLVGIQPGLSSAHSGDAISEEPCA